MAVFLTLGFGLALPFLVLSFVPGLHRSLPKPGAWMERLKQAFAFPMFLTAAWLITVLGNHPAAGATAFGAVILAFGVWLMSVSGGKLRMPVLEMPSHDHHESSICDREGDRQATVNSSLCSDMIPFVVF